MRRIFAILTFLAIVLIFFNPIFKGRIPFPGDLLVGNYGPYNANSYGGFGPGGVPHKAQGPDVIRQLFPWKNFAIEAYKSGQIPFWNPYNLSGNPLMANFQSGVFYPFNIVFLIDFLSGWTLFILLIPILSAFFTYLFLKEINVGNKASIFGGLVFAFSSYMTVWMEYGNVGHTFLWLPLGFLFTEKLAKRFTKKTFLLLIFTLTFSFLAGYIQGYFYIISALFFYFISRAKNLKTLNLKSLLIFFLAIFYSLIIGAFQFLPTLELFSLSSRHNYSLLEIDKILNPFWYTITTIIPDFFGNPASRNTWFYGTYIERVSYFGLIPFVLAIFAVLNLKRKNEIFIFSILFFSSLFLATNLFLNKFIYLIPFPVISTTIPTRILSLFVFSGSILSAFGLEFYLKGHDKKITKILLALGIFFALVWAILIGISGLPKDSVWLSNVGIAKRNLILPSVFLIALSLITVLNYKNLFKLKNVIYIGILFLTIFDLFYFFNKITPFSPKEFVYPQTEVFNYLKNNASIYRVWGYGSGAIENNFQTYEKIFSTDGYEPLHIKDYGGLISASKDGKVAGKIAGSDANLAGGYGKDDLKNNNYRKRLMDLMGVKYVLNKNDFLRGNYNPDFETFPKEAYNLIWQKSPWQIYENKKVLSRVFLTSDYVIEKDKTKVIDLILDPKFDLKKIILEEEPKLRIGQDKDARLKLKKYSPNEIELETESKSNMLLFISDNYYPGWNVSIDGRFDKIYKADYTFRAIAIPEGKHEVKFTYNPGSFILGAWISGISILSLVSFLFISKKRNVKQ